jgi:Fic family protein
MNATPTQEWEPIKDLPQDWQSMKSAELHALENVWKDQSQRLTNSQSYKNFLEKMRRRIAIETGILERLYTIDRGITQLLIERGIDEALIPHGATNRPAATVVDMIRDHERAVEGLFDYVAGQQPLTLFFIWSLHQVLTRHQGFVEARDQFGNMGQVELIRGDWKRFPNNPTKPNGEIHYYCPPEQVQSQMEKFVEWHLQHERGGVSPEIEAAWLHHRFTQIHPFQDGNGRVARSLASLVFIRAHWFPLVVTRDDRENYLDALEAADKDDLKPLVDLFINAQRQAFVSALSLSEQVLSEEASVPAILSSVVDSIQKNY